MENKKDFKSGASSSGNLPPYECLTEIFLRRSAERMKLGMHYGKHNWKKGARDKDFILDRLNHAFEHLIKAMSDIDSDVVGKDDNLSAVVVNCMFAMEYEESLKEPKDIPKLLFPYKEICTLCNLNNGDRIREVVHAMEAHSARLNHPDGKLKYPTGELFLLTPEVYKGVQEFLSNQF